VFTVAEDCSSIGFVASGSARRVAGEMRDHSLDNVPLRSPIRASSRVSQKRCATFAIFCTWLVAVADRRGRPLRAAQTRAGFRELLRCSLAPRRCSAARFANPTTSGAAPVAASAQDVAQLFVATTERASESVSHGQTGVAYIPSSVSCRRSRPKPSGTLAADHADHHRQRLE
jgi:hypothetical protein